MTDTLKKFKVSVFMCRYLFCAEGRLLLVCDIGIIRKWRNDTWLEEKD